MLEPADIEQALIERGVNANIAAWVSVWMEPAAVQRTIEWFDAQGGRVEAGVLVDELRKGGRPEPRRTMLDEQQAYGESITAWLSENLPDLVDERGAPHPFAWISVWRLHARVGKDGVSAEEHGDEIRAYVELRERALAPSGAAGGEGS